MGRLDSQEAVRKSVRRIKVAHSTRTDVGQVRSENQDSYGYALTKRCELFVVADGMGGAGGGATASAIAVNVILRTAICNDGRITEASLMGAIQKAHNSIFEVSKSEEALTKMGTTVVALALVDDKAIIGHVGDSRLYMAKNGDLRQLTRDHTLVQELVDSGTISKGDAENHPMAHYLTRSLSPESAARAEVYSYPYDIDPGDKFLLCCDGLYNMVENNEITQVLEAPDVDTAAQTLVDLANERGGNDNITVQLVEVQGFYDDSSVISKVEEGQVELVLSSDYRDSGFNSVAVQVIESVLAQNRKELAEQAAVDAKEVARTAAAQKSSSRSSAVDGIIFGDANPSSADIKDHEAEYGQTPQPGDNGRQNSQDTTADPEQPKLAFNVPGAATRRSGVHQIDPEQEKSLRTMVVSLAVVCIIAVLGAAVFVYRHQNKNVNRPSKLTQSSVSANSQPPSVKPLIVTPLEPQKPSPNIPGVDNAHDGGDINAVVGLNSPSGENTNSNSDGVLKQSNDIKTTTSSGAEGANSPENSSEANKESNSEPQVIAALNAESESLGLSSAADTAENKDGLSALAPDEQQKLETVAQAISAASALDVPPPPEISIPAEEQKPNQPIDWDKEKAAKAAQKDLAAPPAASVSALQPELAQPIVAESEQYQIISQKIELREKIADLDAKIRNFQIPSKDQQSQKAAELQEQIKGVELALLQVQGNLESAKRRLDKWIERHDAFLKHDAAALLRLADEVSISSVQVKRKKEAYDIASLRHVEAVELWSENPSDNNLAAKMAALGRELKERQANLEAALGDAIEQSVRDARFDLTEAGVSQADLKRRQERLNRQLGFLKAATPEADSSKSRMELQRSLFDERTKLSAKLEELKTKISDSSELELRRKDVLKDLNIQVP